ncbi:MAG: YgiT-type zinc finger protein [Symbiobacteriia bacterium]
MASTRNARYDSLKAVWAMVDGSRWLTTYEAMKFVRGQGNKVSTASIRRACEAGAIPFAERHAIGDDRGLWLIPRRGLSDWVTEGMPGRHHYQVELIRTGKRQIPARLKESSDEGVTDWPVKGESGEMVIVRNTPATVCPHCGEASARTDVRGHIDQLIASGHGETAQHQVIQYEPPREDVGREGNPPKSLSPVEPGGVSTAGT